MSQNDLVWDVYDHYRTARLNVKYYSARLARLEKINMAFEISIAVSAPSSAISGLFFWSTNTGAFLWQFISAFVAIVGFLKPFLKHSHKIKMYEQTLSGYRSLEHDLSELCLKIKEEKSYTNTCRKSFEAILKKKKALAISPPENEQDKSLINKLMDEVNSELPQQFFYVPS